jgi:hypothetical protein
MLSSLWIGGWRQKLTAFLGRNRKRRAPLTIGARDRYWARIAPSWRPPEPRPSNTWGHRHGPNDGPKGDPLAMPAIGGTQMRFHR